MFQDDIRTSVFQRLRQHDTQAFKHLLTPQVFARAAQSTGLRLGDNPLNLTNLVWLSIASAWHHSRNFADVLGLTLKLLRDSGAWPASRPQPRTVPRLRSKHDPRGSDPDGVREEAFAKARKQMPWSYWITLIMILAKDFEGQHPDAVRFKDFRLLALDGSCIDLNSWKGLTDHFGTAKNGTARGQTQARMVLLVYPLVRVPLRYELVPLAQGERTVAARLLQDLCPNDLILQDRGFWSYGLFWQIQSQEAFFAIRLMAGVKLRTIRKLGRDDRLVEWTPSDPKWKNRAPESIQLRVIDYQVRGFRPSAVVSNVLDDRAITREEWGGLVGDPEVAGVLHEGLYHRRWEIETALKELKTVQGMEGRPRGRTPETIAYEVAGHVVLYLLIRWLMVEAAKAHDADPLRLSFTGARNELADLSPTLLTASRERVKEVLLPTLLERIASHRVPKRPGRHYPRPHDTQILNKGKGKKRLPSKLTTPTKKG